jgi:predicted NACHT family NTPase
LQELATNPLLLTLLCLSFESTNRFPNSRLKLYREGARLLLKTWDKNRNIRREEAYNQLPIEWKEDLLSQVAYTAFERSGRFFEQEFVEDQIQEYIRNLPNTSIEQSSLQIDGEEVIKSIEAQHGLLVKQAMGTYSFSHSTFQEYFTARWFNKKADGDFGALIRHVADKQWREIFLLTVEMLQSKDNADKLVLGMKREIDGLLAQDEKLQEFLVWVEEKSSSAQTHYKLVMVRAFYFHLAIALNIGRNLFNKLYPDPSATPRKPVHLLELYQYFNICRNWGLEYIINKSIYCGLFHDHDFAHNLYLCFHQNREIYYVARDEDYNTNFTLCITNFTLCICHIDRENQESYLMLAKDQYSEFQDSLHAIREQIPDIPMVFNSPLKNQDSFNAWWEVTGEIWKNQVRDQVIKHRNIGHDWQFSKAQTELLHQYFDANKLLVDCLNSDCYVSREVRAEIEASLLLPIKSLS